LNKKRNTEAFVKTTISNIAYKLVMLESGWFVAELLVEVMKRHLQESTTLPSAVKSFFVVVLYYCQLINCC